MVHTSKGVFFTSPRIRLAASSTSLNWNSECMKSLVIRVTPSISPHSSRLSRPIFHSPDCAVVLVAVVLLQSASPKYRVLSVRIIILNCHHHGTQIILNSISKADNIPELRTLIHLLYYACMSTTFHVVFLPISCIGYFLHVCELA